MKGVLVVLVALGLSCSGGGGGPYPSCCTPQVARNFGYVGTYATDGGMTQVQLIMNPTGETQLTVVRDGTAITQTFQAVISSP